MAVFRRFLRLFCGAIFALVGCFFVVNVQAAEFKCVNGGISGVFVLGPGDFMPDTDINRIIDINVDKNDAAVLKKSIYLGDDNQTTCINDKDILDKITEIGGIKCFMGGIDPTSVYGAQTYDYEAYYDNAYAFYIGFGGKDVPIVIDHRGVPQKNIRAAFSQYVADFPQFIENFFADDKSTDYGNVCPVDPDVTQTFRFLCLPVGKYFMHLPTTNPYLGLLPVTENGVALFSAKYAVANDNKQTINLRDKDVKGYAVVKESIDGAICRDKNNEMPAFPEYYYSFPAVTDPYGNSGMFGEHGATNTNFGSSGLVSDGKLYDLYSDNYSVPELNKNISKIEYEKMLQGAKQLATLTDLSNVLNSVGYTPYPSLHDNYVFLKGISIEGDGTGQYVLVWNVYDSSNDLNHFDTSSKNGVVCSSNVSTDRTQDGSYKFANDNNSCLNETDFSKAKPTCTDEIDVNGDGSTCETAKFTLTTTNMSAGDMFVFALSATGTFYVDWGDGTVETIKKNDTYYESYAHKYTTGGKKQIRFGGTATGYEKNKTVFLLSNPDYEPELFDKETNYYNDKPQYYPTGEYVASISGSLGAIFPTISAQQPLFGLTFFGCKNLTGSIPSNLFARISGAPAERMFYNTFAGCSGLTGRIPANLFARISGAPAEGMFAGTFHNCSGLSGAIPSNLFVGISGKPAEGMFASTFTDCSGLTGAIPENLFAGISGAPATYMFNSTFNGCRGLTGAIPSNLFAGISGAPATYMFSNTFYNCSGLTGAIPENLFAGISGAPANNMFASTFYGCSKLTGFTDGTNTVNYVPGNFLGTIKAATASNQVYQMFQNTGLASTCPSGTTNTTRSQFSNAGKPWCGASYTITYNLNNGAFPVDVVVPTSYITEMTPKALPTPVRDGYNFVGWSNNTKFTGETITEIPAGSTGNKEFWAIWFNASCPADYFMPSDHPEMCFPHVLHIGDNTVYLKSEKQTTPSLNISIGNDVFYANMTTTPTPTNSATEHNLKMIYNNTVYYVCDDTTCSQQ